MKDPNRTETYFVDYISAKRNGWYWIVFIDGVAMSEGGAHRSERAAIRTAGKVRAEYENEVSK